MSRYGKPVPIRASAILSRLVDADALFIQVGAGALGGGEQVVAGRVVDDGLRDLAALLQRDRYAILRKAVDEIGGAVERIDDPDVFIFVVQVGGCAGFFGQDGMVGIGGFAAPR